MHELSEEKEGRKQLQHELAYLQDKILPMILDRLGTHTKVEGKIVNISDSTT